MNNNIKRHTKKAKENCIGEQCSEIEENLRKHNSKRARETAGEILGKHRQKKKTRVTAEILDLCDRWRELRKNNLNLKDLRNTGK